MRIPLDGYRDLTDEEWAREELVEYCRRQLFYSKFNMPHEVSLDKCGTLCGPIFVYTNDGVYLSLEQECKP